MFLTAPDGTDLVQLAWNGHDDEATGILCDVNTSWEKPSDLFAENVRDITARVAPLRNNLSLVPPEQKAAFEKIADLQDEWIAASAEEKVIQHGRPHHYCASYSEAKAAWEAVNPDPVLARPAHGLAFIAINPYDIAKTEKENIDFVTADGRIERQLSIMSERTGVSVKAIAEETVGLCYTSAAKRHWSIANKGGIEPDEAGPNYFMAVAEKAAPYAGIKLG